VDAHPVPTGREEVWRFTPLPRLRGLLTDSGPSGNTLAWQTELPEGVTFEPVSLARARELAVEAPIDRVSALAAQNASYAARLDVPAGLELSEPILVTGQGNGTDVAEHLLITIGAHARATIVLRFTGSATFADKTDLVVGDGASVTYVSIQDWADDAVHAGQHSVLVGRDAQVRTVTVSLGGDVVRLAETARFAGPGGELEQFGLYFVDAGQHIEHRLFVDHNAPHTRSHVDYRGALQGAGAHSVWVGDVLIRKVAEGISTYETNKNLVLTDGCRADSVPNLEIETGEIEGAGHSSTTGRTSSCSTCAPAGSRRRRPGAWWCTGSSPTSSAESACRRWSRGCWRPSNANSRSSSARPGPCGPARELRPRLRPGRRAARHRVPRRPR
jgi:Fe-S cluster assembly protein SufD